MSESLPPEIVLTSIDHTIGKNGNGMYNIRRFQQGDPEFCIGVGGLQGAQLNKHHLRAMLTLIEQKEIEEDQTVVTELPDLETARHIVKHIDLCQIERNADGSLLVRGPTDHLSTAYIHVGGVLTLRQVRALAVVMGNRNAG